MIPHTALAWFGRILWIDSQGARQARRRRADNDGGDGDNDDGEVEHDGGDDDDNDNDDGINIDVVEDDVVVVVTAVVFHLPIVVVAIAAIIVVGIVVFAVAVTIDIVAHRRRACRASWLSKPRRYRPWHGDGAPPLGFAVGLPAALLGRHLVKDVVLSEISWC